MTDNELLLAISNMFEPIRIDIHEIKCRVTAIEGKVDALDIRLTSVENKVDALDTRLTSVENKVDALDIRLTSVEGRLASLENNMAVMNNRIKKIEIVQETEVLPRLNTIESCYTSTLDRYRDSAEDHEMVKQDVSMLKKVVMEHSEKLQKIG